MPILTREQIIAAVDLKRETVAVPEWDGDVIVSEMDGAARDEYEAFRNTLPTNTDDTFKHTVNLRQCAIATCLVDEKGKRVFANGEALGELSGKNSDVIDRLFDIVARINKLTNAYTEETEKNSEGESSEGSG